jgi:isopentenyl phosphate kinase
MSSSGKLVIVKLGGSVITHKASAPPEVDRTNLSRIATELKTHDSRLIVILGGGAHGHQAAHAHGYGNPTTQSSQLLKGIPHVRHNMSTLALEVESILNNAGVPGVVISPFTTVWLKDGIITDFPLNLIQKTLDSNLVVISHGDVCFDTIKGASILSGDTIAVHLARELSAAALYLGTDVDGVLEDDPRRNPQAQLIPVISDSNKDEALKRSGPSSATDVTGGMSKKISELITLSSSGTEIAIFNLTVPNRLSDLLLGKPIPCTRITV